MPINIYSETLEERIIPAQLIRPSIRIIVPTPLTTVGDTIEVITKVNGTEVGDSIKYAVEQVIRDKNVVATVTLALCDQKSANLPSIKDQVANEWVTKTASEKVLAKVAILERDNLTIKE
jgi:hypothetical protein